MLDQLPGDRTSRAQSTDREQRGALRLALNPGEAKLEAFDTSDVELVDVSVSGVGLVLPRDFNQHSLELSGVLRLGERSTVVRLEPTRSILDADTMRIGARFLDPTHEMLNSVGDFLIQGFVRREQSLAHLDQSRGKTLRISNAQLISRLLRDKLIRHRLPLRVYQGDVLM